MKSDILMSNIKRRYFCMVICQINHAFLSLCANCTGEINHVRLLDSQSFFFGVCCRLDA